ncbi:MAG: hypothetical protein ACREJM_04305 [Candidatus Saccharimonadales bacterium]
MNAFIRFLYALLVAGAVTAFTGLAVYSFYQPPKSPRYPSYDYSAYSYNSAAYKRQQNAYDQAVHRYDQQTKAYDRHVTYILLGAAFLSAGAGLYLIRRRAEVIAEGLTLAAVALSIYAIIEASSADARILRFAAVTLLLIIALLAAHFRFLEPRSKPKHPVYGPET